MNSGKILQRFFKNCKLTSDQWDDLFEDFKKGESKSIICTKFSIKNGYYKAVKEYMIGNNNG